MEHHINRCVGLVYHEHCARGSHLAVRALKGQDKELGWRECGIEQLPRAAAECVDLKPAIMRCCHGQLAPHRKSWCNTRTCDNVGRCGSLSLTSIWIAQYFAFGCPVIQSSACNKPPCLQIEILLSCCEHRAREQNTLLGLAAVSLPPPSGNHQATAHRSADPEQRKSQIIHENC